MSDPVVAILGIAAGGVAVVAARAIFLWIRKGPGPIDRMTGRDLRELSFLQYEALTAKVELLGQQFKHREAFSSAELAACVTRLEGALEDTQGIATALEHMAQILERDNRLDDAQRAKIAKIRAKINRGIAALPAQSGSSGQGDV